MTELIVALDVGSLKEQEQLLKNLRGAASFYKVGLRLFTSEGRKAVDLVRKYEGKVFLDLKLMDIPRTIVDTVMEIGKMGVYSASIYIWGGMRMLEAASLVVQRPKLWGVTVLTSLEEEDLEAFHVRDVKNLVRDLALSGQNFLDGFVCSGEELSIFKDRFKKKPTLIVPGVRPAGFPSEDQRRVVTPGEAARMGADFVVVGRPVTKAKDPAKAARDILEEMKSAAPNEPSPAS